MRHYALQASKRNVNALSSEHHSITCILQAAAGRAWTRRYHDFYAPRRYWGGEKTTNRAGPSSRPTHDVHKPSLSVKLDCSSLVAKETTSPQPSEISQPHARLIPKRLNIFETRPKSKNEFCQIIAEWSITPTFRPRSRFNILHAYHNEHPLLWSMNSFRLLAQTAIDAANVGGMRLVFKELGSMGSSPIDWNLAMWAIWVRWMVRQGEWQDAWDTIMRRFVNERATGMPLKVWTEFWGTAKLRTVRRWMIEKETGRPHLRPLELPDELYSSMKRYHLLVENSPMLTEKEMRVVPAWLIYAVVRARLWNGRREWAMELTRNFFRSAVGYERHTEMCLKLLNLHLGLGWKKMGFQTLRAMQKTMDELLELNGEVKPNSKTVVLLLAALNDTKRSGINASRLVKKLKGRFGESLEDQRVRHRMLCLAAKEGSLKVMHRMVNKPAIEEQTGWIKREPATQKYRNKLLSIRNRVQKRVGSKATNLH